MSQTSQWRRRRPGPHLQDAEAGETDLVALLQPEPQQRIGHHVGAPVEILPALALVTTHHRRLLAEELGVDPEVLAGR